MSAAARAGLRIAVVGASSLIGAAVVDELRARKMAFAELHGLDDERNIGRTVTDETSEDSAANPLAVSDIAAFDFSRVDLVFFCGRAADRCDMRRAARIVQAFTN